MTVAEVWTCLALLGTDPRWQNARLDPLTLASESKRVMFRDSWTGRVHVFHDAQDLQEWVARMTERRGEAMTTPHAAGEQEEWGVVTHARLRAPVAHESEEHMETITLYTAQGEAVTTVQIPPFSPQAEGLLWGSRAFFRHPDGRYYEGMLYTVIQTMREERKRERAALDERITRAQDEARQTAALAQDAQDRAQAQESPRLGYHQATPYFGERDTD